MPSATFGRRGLAADVVGQPAPRRRQFGQAGITAAAPGDPVADRRAAFLAAERARAADVEDRDESAAPFSPGEAKVVLVGGKSLGTAYVLWFFLGGFSAHRFYMGSPLTAIAQVSLWYISLMFWMAGHQGAGYSLAAGWLWIFGDVFFIPKLRDAANERIRRRAGQLVEPLSS